MLHAAYNQLVASPRAATLAVLLVLPALLFWVFRRSERSTADWLGQGFDADAAMLEALNSGSFADSPAGRYLQSLKRRFRGPIVADLLCYLRLHTELALRAKGILMMRESGFDSPLDDQTRAKFDEVRYLEKDCSMPTFSASEARSATSLPWAKVMFLRRQNFSKPSGPPK